MNRTLIFTLCCLLAASTLPAQGTRPSNTCADEVRARVPASNPGEVCRILLAGRDPDSGTDLSRLYDVRTQDAGDGSRLYVFSQSGGGKDPYAYVPTFVFENVAGRLELRFDGDGLPVRFVTDRPRVNGRYQIERTSRADIAGLYRKREVEIWFWTGTGYEKAGSRLTIENAADPGLNGTRMVWSPEAGERYKNASPRWTHRVKSGETLSGIARRYGVSVSQIVAQNGLRDADRLRLGQVLRYEGWRRNAGLR